MVSMPDTIEAGALARAMAVLLAGEGSTATFAEQTQGQALTRCQQQVLLAPGGAAGTAHRPPPIPGAGMGHRPPPDRQTCTADPTYLHVRLQRDAQDFFFAGRRVLCALTSPQLRSMQGPSNSLLAAIRTMAAAVLASCSCANLQRLQTEATGHVPGGSNGISQGNAHGQQAATVMPMHTVDSRPSSLPALHPDEMGCPDAYAGSSVAQRGRDIPTGPVAVAARGHIASFVQPGTSRLGAAGIHNAPVTSAHIPTLMPPTHNSAMSPECMSASASQECGHVRGGPQPEMQPQSVYGMPHAPLQSAPVGNMAHDTRHEQKRDAQLAQLESAHDRCQRVLRCGMSEAVQWGSRLRPDVAQDRPMVQPLTWKSPNVQSSSEPEQHERLLEQLRFLVGETSPCPVAEYGSSAPTLHVTAGTAGAQRSPSPTSTADALAIRQAMLQGLGAHHADMAMAPVVQSGQPGMSRMHAVQARPAGAHGRDWQLLPSHSVITGGQESAAARTPEHEWRSCVGSMPYGSGYPRQ
eukprot:jgi/Ulvmu1/8443/UM043_0021.1